VADSPAVMNLKNLLDQARQDFAALGLDPSIPNCCLNMADILPLSHAIPSAAFVNLTTDAKAIGYKLLSPAMLDEHGIKSLRPESAEVALGTEKFVFLYCGQFRYPETQVGFLFATTLETEQGGANEASPFDSGALHNKAVWPDLSESAVAFLARHTLPVPAYRKYLGCRLHWLFAEPEHYLAPNATPVRTDPIGLRPKDSSAVPDPRLWTFEVRVRDEVNLCEPHLEAVFYPGRLVGQRAVREFLAAHGDGIHLEEFTPEDEGDFATLQSRCLEFLRARGMIH
jgi:hypothetical protein